MSFETNDTAFGFLPCLLTMKNTTTEGRFGTFNLLSCSEVYVKEASSDATVRNCNSSNDKRNCYNPFTS